MYFTSSRWILWMTLSTVVCSAWAESLSAPSNEIDTPTVRIDPILRKALLKALSNLEREELEDENTTTESSTTLSEELLEESTSSDRKPLVQYHTYIIDSNNTNRDSDGDTIFQTIILPKTTLSPPKQEKTEKKKIVFSVPDPVKDSDIKIETVQLARSVTTNVQANEIFDDRQVVKTTPSKDLIKTTSTTTFPSTTTAGTTTTEAPVTNADGQNVEKVKDVQIHQAPLVAAFTVQQDALGLPKSVVPIYKHAEPQSATTIQSVPAIQVLPQAQPQTPLLPTPTSYQQALEQKQRELEQKIQLLQAQQRQQEHLIRQHQFFQEQQNLQRQQHLLLEQRLRIEEQRLRQQQYEQEQRIQRLRQRLPLPLSRSPGADGNVQLLSSLSLTPPNGVLLEQQLPVKGPVNFHGQELIFTQPPQTPPQLSSSLQTPQRPFVNFHPNRDSSFPPLNNFQTNPDRNRVFRHNSDTGNFGFNNNNNFSQQQQQLRQLPPVHNTAANQQLQNLLFQSGLSSRSQEEDLNIITRVLALNHGITAPVNNYINGRQQNFV
ncbi:hypothetical protein DMENIID0001_087700 [Sergentomyia squamirostris]